LISNPRIIGIAFFQHNGELLTKDFNLDIPFEVINKFEKLPMTEWCFIIKHYMRQVIIDNFETNEQQQKGVHSK
jgi:hypothetical protein